MTKAKFVLALFLAVCASTLYAADSLDSLPAYCVTFPTDSSYRIHLIRHTKDFQSNYGCGCSNHSDKDEFFINFPRNLNKKSYTWMTYNLENAKRVLPEFYGQTFRGNKSETKCKGDSYERKEQEFDILLVDIELSMVDDNVSGEKAKIMVERIGQKLQEKASIPQINENLFVRMGFDTLVTGKSKTAPATDGVAETMYSPIIGIKMERIPLGNLKLDLGADWLAGHLFVKDIKAAAAASMNLEIPFAELEKVKLNMNIGVRDKFFLKNEGLENRASVIMAIGVENVIR